MSIVHDLKTLPAYFDAVERGEKTFEIRRDDRGFQKGDTVRLFRLDTSGHTTITDRRIVEALRREAREQKFRRDLAESECVSLKERLCRAAHLAFAGNDRALRRLVDTIENPRPIYDSAALAQGRDQGENGRG